MSNVQFAIGDRFVGTHSKNGGSETVEKWQADLDTSRNDGTYQKVFHKIDSAPNDNATTGSGSRVEDLNPRYKDMTIDKLREHATKMSSRLETIEEAKSAYKELITRFDLMLSDSDIDKGVKAIGSLMQALQSGKDIKKNANPDGTFSIDPSKTLTQERRWMFHVAINRDVEAINDQIQTRLEFSQLLKAANQNKDAEAMAREAVAKAARLTQPININGKTTTLQEMIGKEANQLLDDFGKITDRQRQLSMIDAVRYLKGVDANTGVINTPSIAKRNLEYVQGKNWF